jgi:hypothetical protein
MNTDRWVSAAAIAALALFAAAAVSDEIETHGTHEHGVAVLNVGIEASRVEIEFESPSINVVGFERAPKTEGEHAAVAQAEQQLGDGQRLFVLTPAAECRLLSAGVDTPSWGQSGHADYEARYVYECAKPHLLRSIDVRLIHRLSDKTKLRVQIAGAQAQTMAELTKAKSLVTIR